MIAAYPPPVDPNYESNNASASVVTKSANVETSSNGSRAPPSSQPSLCATDDECEAIVLNESDQRVLAGKSPSISASRTHGSIDTAAAALDLISFLEGKARELAVSADEAAEDAEKQDGIVNNMGYWLKTFRDVSTSLPSWKDTETDDTKEQQTKREKMNTTTAAAAKAASASSVSLVPPSSSDTDMYRVTTLSTQLQSERDNHELTRHRLSAATQRIAELTAALHAQRNSLEVADLAHAEALAAHDTEHSQNLIFYEKKLAMATEDADRALELARTESARAEKAEVALERLLLQQHREEERRSMGSEGGTPREGRRLHTPRATPLGRGNNSVSSSVASQSPSVRSIRAGRELLASRRGGAPPSPEDGSVTSSSSSVGSSSVSRLGGVRKVNLSRAAAARDRLAGRITAGMASFGVRPSPQRLGNAMNLSRAFVGATDGKKIIDLMNTSWKKVEANGWIVTETGEYCRPLVYVTIEEVATKYVRDMEALVSHQKDEMDKLRNFCNYLEKQMLLSFSKEKISQPPT
eukprot:CAMPEP_0113315850 /NCGR_PEP_ID=MMETSP0010_2-20120614/11353_1 /TAXON_ID=216773 ORGANISM="Corethron hystrix, Strain 308" /NCGR_SAMPLE_ID=MMETSP0010_2 /ASSEMBLY_ACC=CAM_ASM_000155 /LENGTH=524 /DNA_ID=CAMNT_0000172433 /DNA_START=41 /DNA_END=1616 /DNA_ORIENTATION=- /assembly_acc=CAM_ASM_000155